MSDKKFVQSVLPTALCALLEDLPFGTGVNYDPNEPMYVIYALDGHTREYIVGHSTKSEDDAWKQVAETFRQKMICQLEAA